jgi:hypothetical protein
MNTTKGEANMNKQYQAIKPFDYLTPGDTYTTWPLELTHTRFWNEQKQCGTFIANWLVENAVKQGLLKEIV